MMITGQPSDADLDALRALVPREFLEELHRIVRKKLWGHAGLEVHFQNGEFATNFIETRVSLKRTK
jgi:hypothetical protein